MRFKNGSKKKDRIASNEKLKEGELFLQSLLLCKIYDITIQEMDSQFPLTVQMALARAGILIQTPSDILSEFN